MIGVGVAFELLGTLRVLRDGRPVAIPAARHRAILATLLLRANSVVSVDRLADALWPDGRPTTALPTLRTYVMRLRQALGPDIGARIRTSGPGYVIDVRDGELDVDRFAALHSAALAAARAERWAEAFQAATDALALWRDDALTDVFPTAPALGEEVSRLAELRLRTADVRAEAGLRLGRHAELIVDLRAVIAANPFHEAAHSQLMLALYRSDRQSEALDQFQALRRVLHADLGVVPGPEVTRLHQRILESDPGLAATAATATSASGAATAVSGGADVPAPASALLPPDISDFIGRVPQLAELRRLLTQSVAEDEPPRPLVVSTITGAGGVGKTTLALHAAHGLAARFPDGQLFVSLAGASACPRDPYDALGDVLDALGVSRTDMPAGLDARSARFRSLTAGRRMLLVLDDARDAAQVRPLLPGSGSCGVVTTSRSWLPGLDGAVPLALDVMDRDEARALFASVIGAARAAAEPEACEAVLAVCAGLPLAIRIAGGRLAARPGWSVAELAARLADERGRLDELAMADVAVRASFEMSYASLSEAGTAEAADRARAFRLLGLWPQGTLGRDAAAALLGMPRAAAEAALESLVDTHLVESPAAGVFRLHDLLRVYARERVEAEDGPETAAAAIDRLIHWFTHTAAHAADQYIPKRAQKGLELVPESPEALDFPDRATALAWYLAERATLTTAILLANEGSASAAGWVLPAQLAQFYIQCGHWSDAEPTHLAGLRTAEALGDAAGQIEMARGLFGVYNAYGLKQEAVDITRRALDLARTLDDRRVTAVAEVDHASALIDVERYDEAIELYEKALQGVESVFSKGGHSNLLHNMGECHAKNGNLPRALELFEQALALAEEFGAPFLIALAKSALGDALRRAGETAAGIEMLTSAVDLAVQAGARSLEGETRNRLGDALAAAGVQDGAVAAWRETLAIWEQIGDQRRDVIREKLAASDPAA